MNLASVTPTYAEGLTRDGWVIMLLSVSFVTILLVWCLYKVMISAPPDVGDEPAEVEAYRREAEGREHR